MEPETKRCPFCAEDVRAEATKCRYCQSILVEARSSWLRNVGGFAAYAIGAAVLLAAWDLLKAIVR